MISYVTALWIPPAQDLLFNHCTGRDDPIGVENLRGSGMIAGAMSKAYDEVVTLSLVSF